MIIECPICGNTTKSGACMICGYEVATDFIAYPAFHATIANNLRFRVDC